MKRRWQPYEEDDRFDYDLLEEDWPFEIDTQTTHLFKHDDIQIIQEVWEEGVARYVATRFHSAHWFLVGLVGDECWSIPLCPANRGGSTKCRPIGVYKASRWVIEEYRAQGKRR